jgi:hypothetical protein
MQPLTPEGHADAPGFGLKRGLPRSFGWSEGVVFSSSKDNNGSSVESNDGSSDSRQAVRPNRKQR